MHKLNNNKTYRSFVNDRDTALEVLLKLNRLKNTEINNQTFIKLIDLVRARYDLIKNAFMQFHSMQKIRQLDAEIEQLFYQAAAATYENLILLRKKSTLLAYASEFQAIKASTGIDRKLALTANQITDVAIKDKLDKADAFKKIQYEYGLVKNRVIAAVKFSLMLDEDVNKAVGRVYLALPKLKQMPKKQALKRVKRLTEADKPGLGLSLNFDKKSKNVFGFEIDPATWDQIISDYNSDYVPTTRTPDTVFDITNPWNDEPMRTDIPSDEAFYGWQVEQDITHDFVDQVRSGQVQAANDNGVDDFVVISIIDNKTCEKCCGDFGCVDFNGMLVSEIEKMVGKGFDAVPPYHFNCRCTIAPASKDLPAVDETQSIKDFNEWLSQ